MTQHEKNMKYTLTTQAIEKLRPSQIAIDLCEQVGAGEISADTAVSVLLKYYALDRVRTNGNGFGKHDVYSVPGSVFWPLWRLWCLIQLKSVLQMYLH